MSNKFWASAGTLKPVETEGGGKVAQDYFGLHKKDEANITKVTAHLFQDKAKKYLKEAEREQLNFGEPFNGTIEVYKIRHISIYIANHPEHGTCAFLNERTSLHPSKVEIFINAATEKLVVDRNSFFSRILTEPIQEKAAENICTNYERIYILLEKI